MLMLTMTSLDLIGLTKNLWYNMGKYSSKLIKLFRDHELYEFADADLLGSGKYSEVFEGYFVNEPSKKCVIKILKPVRIDKIRREISIL